MGFRLAPTASANGFCLEVHESISSTNELALERALAGDLGSFWVVSKKQENGRGRRGRAWLTQEGNLAATLLMKLDRDLQHAATLGFVAGLALADALDTVAPNAHFSVDVDGDMGQGVKRFELKWPNDVLASGAKLAGILLESILLVPGRLAIAIGIGVNVVTHPDDVPYPATSLSTLGADVDAETLFLALSDAWSKNEQLWNSDRGFAVIREKWLMRAAGLGSEVAVMVDGNVVRGTFETLDEDCRFVIRDIKGETVKIAAGDVHFGAVASADAT